MLCIEVFLHCGPANDNAVSEMPLRTKVSLIHSQPSRCLTVANLLCCVSQWAILALLLEEPSVQCRVSSAEGLQGKERGKKGAQDKGGEYSQEKAPQTSSWEVDWARDGNCISKGGWGVSGIGNGP